MTSFFPAALDHAFVHHIAPEAPRNDEIVATRVFSASRTTVFQACMDPALFSRWWGPKEFTNTFQEFDPSRAASGAS